MIIIRNSIVKTYARHQCIIFVNFHCLYLKSQRGRNLQPLERLLWRKKSNWESTTSRNLKERSKRSFGARDEKFGKLWYPGLSSDGACRVCVRGFNNKSVRFFTQTILKWKVLYPKHNSKSPIRQGGTKKMSNLKHDQVVRKTKFSLKRSGVSVKLFTFE